jgi:hypothetical protein
MILEISLVERTVFRMRNTLIRLMAQVAKNTTNTSNTRMKEIMLLVLKLTADMIKDR